MTICLGLFHLSRISIPNFLITMHLPLLPLAIASFVSLHISQHDKEHHWLSLQQYQMAANCQQEHAPIYQHDVYSLASPINGKNS